MREISFSKDTNKTLKLFRKIDKFSDLDDEDLINFVKYGKIGEYEANEVIIQEGDYDCWVHFLINGSLNILKGEHKVGILNRCGDVFGEMGVIDGSARSATIVANSNVWLLSFDSSVIDSKLKDNQTNFCYIIYRIFAEVMAVRLRNTTEENARLRKVQERLENELHILKGTGTSKKSTSNFQAKDIKNVRILLVDSTETTRKLIKSILRELGFRTINEAYDGYHALDILDEEPIDLILSEWKLPKLSGLDLLSRVRRGDRCKETPFIMIMGKSDAKYIDIAAEEQVSQCLIKPYSSNTVLEKIADVLC